MMGKLSSNVVLVAMVAAVRGMPMNYPVLHKAIDLTHAAADNATAKWPSPAVIPFELN